MASSDKVSTPHAPLFHYMSRRMHLLLLIAFGLFNSSTLNFNFSIATTCMVNYTALSIQRHQSDLEVYQLLSGTSDANMTEPEIDLSNVVDYGGSLIWDSSIQNWLLSASFWGGIATMIPAIYFVQRLSPKYVFVCCIANKALMNAILPTLANTLGYKAVFAARFILGLSEPFIYPSINTIASNWFPSEERSTAVALFTTGNQLAMFLGNPISAGLCSSPFGWPSVFYFTAILSVIWCILWLLFSANHPDDCKHMSNIERNYLSCSTVRKVSNIQKRDTPVPWKAILTNSAFLSHLFSTYVISVVATLMMTYLPLYFKDVLLLSVIANGAFTSVPMFCNFVFKLVWGFTVDRLKQKHILTMTQGVKLSQCYPTFGVAVPLFLVIMFVNSDTRYFALVLFCMANMFLGAHTSGAYTSLLSLAPQFTASLSSISCSLSMVSALTTPLAVGQIMKTGSMSEWNTVLMLCVILSALSGVQFLIYGSGDVQPFAQSKTEQPEEHHDMLLMRDIRVSSLRADSVSLLA